MHGGGAVAEGCEGEGFSVFLVSQGLWFVFGGQYVEGRTGNSSSLDAR